MPVIRVEGLRSFLWFPVVASFLSNRKEVQGWPGFTPGACGHGRRFSALKGQGGAIEEAMLLLAQGHQYLICTLHTHTHTHTHTDLHTDSRTCAPTRAPKTLPPPPQSCYCGLHLCSLQLKTDRIRASLHPPAAALPPWFSSH